jgi:peptidoglycan/LPS O-acetylase OafA/YrhL
LRAAGLVSYSLYLWHYPILLFAVRWLAVDQVPAMAIPAVFLGLAATAAVTAVSYRWIERPLLYRSGRRTMPEVGTPVPAVTRTFSTSST